MNNTMRSVICILSLCFTLPFAAFAEAPEAAEEGRTAGEVAKDAAVAKADALRAEHGLSEDEAAEVAEAYRRGGEAEESHGEQVSGLVRAALDEDCRGECLAERLRAFNAPEAADRAAAHRLQGDAAARERGNAAARERGEAAAGAAREGAMGRDRLPEAAGRSGEARRSR